MFFLMLVAKMSGSVIVSELRQYRRKQEEWKVEKLKKQNEKIIAKEKVKASLMRHVINLPIPASDSLMQTSRVTQCVRA